MSMIRLFLSALVCLSMIACTAPGGGGSATLSKAAKVSLRDYRTGTTLSIVNDGYIAKLGVEGEDADTRRVAFYSEKHADPTTKVTKDEVLLATIRQLEKEGFDRWSSPGRSPGDSSTASSSIEIELASGARHFLRHPGLKENQARDHLSCYRVFQEIYNVIEQYQSVDPDDFRFDSMPVRGAERD